MKAHAINDSQSFIAGWYLDNSDICDELIQFYKDSPEKHAGITSTKMDKAVKDSTDVTAKGKVAQKYGAQLQTVVEEYIKKYPYCNYYAAWSMTSPIVVQHYNPGQGFHAWHCERETIKEPNSTRHLVFTTYLNDVTDDGETEFFHQNVKIKPEKGLTVLFPADWTFTHRGITSKTQEKYIATGWFNFVQ
jgi:hypothetical protein